MNRTTELLKEIEELKAFEREWCGLSSNDQVELLECKAELKGRQDVLKEVRRFLKKLSIPNYDDSKEAYLMNEEKTKEITKELNQIEQK